jgi:hypothetical protein
MRLNTCVHTYHTYIPTYIHTYHIHIYCRKYPGEACRRARIHTYSAAVRMEAEAGPFKGVVCQVCACLAECTKHTHTTRKRPPMLRLQATAEPYACSS